MVEERPWGWYENLSEGTGYKVKRLFVEKDKKISLQYHNYRNEHWIVVAGSGSVETGNNIRNVFIGDYIFVPTL